MTEPTSPEPPPEESAGDSPEDEGLGDDRVSAAAVGRRLADQLESDGISVDEVGETDVEIADGQIAYECNAWSAESRELLASLLHSKEIAHVWQGTTVTVRAEDEDAVDDLIDDVLASARPALDPSAPKLVYEVGTWPVALQTDLAESLAIDDIPYEWNENGDLVVRASDEDAVAEVLAELPDPDDGAVSSDDGVALHELLDKVFMSSDRLAKHATDASATVTLVESAQLLSRVALPFGFEPGQWRRLVADAQALGDAIDPPVSDDGAAAPVSASSDSEISELAGALRDQIRQYI